MNASGSDRVAHCGQRAIHLRHGALAGGATHCGPARELRLDHTPGVEQVRQIHRVLAEAEIENLLQHSGSGDRYTRTLALARDEDTTCDQRADRLTHGEAVDAVPLGEFGLGRDLIARPQTAQLDVADDLLSYVLTQRRPPDRHAFAPSPLGRSRPASNPPTQLAA